MSYATKLRMPRAEEAPTDTIHIPAGATNVEDAKKFLAFVVSADAQTKMGFMYANGQGAPQDSARAAHWFAKAATQGDATAQFRQAKRHGIAKRIALHRACQSLPCGGGCGGGGLADLHMDNVTSRILGGAGGAQHIHHDEGIDLTAP